MYTGVYLCIPMYTCVYWCAPGVYPCILMCTHVRISVYTHVHWCIPVYTGATPVYMGIHQNTQVYMGIHQYSAQIINIIIKVYNIILILFREFWRPI